MLTIKQHDKNLAADNQDINAHQQLLETKTAQFPENAKFSKNL